MQRVVGPLCNVTGDARVDNTHNGSDDTFSQALPGSSPDFCWHHQLSGQESQCSRKKDKTVVRFRTSIRCELCLSVFVTPFSNIFVQLNP